MARIAQLEPDIFAAWQLDAGDFADLAARGFRSVVNNRPDGEAADQLPTALAEAAARRHGLQFRYQPVDGLTVTDDDVVDAFARAMAELPRPILFYCRSGMRSAAVWAQAAASRLGIDRVLESTAKAGYTLEDLREDLVERMQRMAEQEALLGRGVRAPADRGIDARHHLFGHQHH
jgi:sulfide:quinone oxidoreductase